MQEIELKFLVPEARLKGLLRQADVKSSQLTHMAAHYYDTPKQELAKAGIGLRIRQEGDAWVQTIKAASDGMAARLEHNALLDNEHVQAMLDTDTLMPDLTLYKDTAIAPILADFKLKKLTKKLTRLYVTDVQRITRLLEEETADNNNKETNRIEIAFDKGNIINGSDDSQHQAIQEIEFELVLGELKFLFTTAKVWCRRYKLCLSTVTKAERGGLLIKGQAYSPAVSADFDRLTVNQDSNMAEFIRAVMHNCLLQILPNSSAIVAGSSDNEHILQLRIGIRRLRVALKAFNKFSEQLNPEWLPILKQTERLLGDYRELAYLASRVEPKLEQQGAPTVDWSADVERIKITPINAVGANDFQLTLLELIEFTMSDASLEPQAKQLSGDKLAKILSKKHIKLLKAEHHLDDLKDTHLNKSELSNAHLKSSQPNSSKVENDDIDQSVLYNEAQHKVRRHLKNLRYISEFAAPLYDNKKSKRFIKQLTKAQQTLGKYHDNQQYQQRYQQRALTDSNALYGAGWFAALAKSDLKNCRKRLAKVRDSDTFW